MNSEHFPLIDAVDHLLLMHRDAHFGGDFGLMLDYYKKGGKGVQPEFDYERIESLTKLEKELGQNLAALFLSAEEMQKVADARLSYQKLRDIYEVSRPKSIHPRLLADLILSEEEEAEREIAAICSEKGAIVPALIDLLRTEQLHDPLFPGYGKAAEHIVCCLEKIGDKRAIISLFEAIGQGDFFEDNQVIKALKAIGKPAKDFLLRVLKAKPLTEDNEKAAIALVAFKEDKEVVDTCFALLQQQEVLRDPCLPTYLVCICVETKDPVQQQLLKVMSMDKSLPNQLRKDIRSQLD